MDAVYFLAQFWGFSLVIISLAFLVHPKYFEYVLNAIEEPKNVLLCGILHVMAGLAALLAYNTWDKSWKVILTILAWLILLRGLVCLFFPNIVKKMLAKVRLHVDWSATIFFGCAILGCILIYLGFSS